MTRGPREAPAGPRTAGGGPACGRSAPARATAFGATLALAVASAGCQRIDRIRECRALARATNPALASIDAARTAAPEDPLAHRALSMQYEAVAGAVARLGIRSRRLLEPVSEYEKLLREAGQGARAYADALESRDAARIAAARGAATRTAKREGPVVAKLDAACRAR